MTEKDRKKYDTNPLDPDYARNIDDVWGASAVGSHTEEIKGATRDMARTPNEQARNDIDAEAPTRRYNTPLASTYPSVFVPPAYQPLAGQQQPFQPATPTVAAPPPPPTMRQAPTSRTVAGISLPENIVMIVPYIPFHIGIVAAIIELLLVPRSEVRVRFHAAQGLALHLAVLLIGFLFTIVALVSGSGFGGVIFSLAATIFFIVSIIRVWKGEPHHIAPLDEATRWLDSTIAPRK